MDDWRLFGYKTRMLNDISSGNASHYLENARLGYYNDAMLEAFGEAIGSGQVSDSDVYAALGEGAVRRIEHLTERYILSGSIGDHEEMKIITGMMERDNRLLRKVGSRTLFAHRRTEPQYALAGEGAPESGAVVSLDLV